METFLPALRALQTEGEKTREQVATMENLAAPDYLYAAQTLYSPAVERTKEDISVSLDSSSASGPGSANFWTVCRTPWM